MIWTRLRKIDKIWMDSQNHVIAIFQDTVLWACLATMAAYAKDLNTAETAYAAIDEVGTKAYF